MYTPAASCRAAYRLPVGRRTLSDLRADVRFSAARSALIVGHPGHSLRIHGWMEAARPLTFILTDGSGHDGRSRVESSHCLLACVGSRSGSLFGRFTDGEVYSALLDHDFRLLRDVVAELAAALVTERIDYVVGDATEGYNPTHDVMRLMIDQAIRQAEQQSEREIANYDFVLVDAPDACPDRLRDQAVWLQLDDDAIARKLQAAEGFTELKQEVERALALFGREAFRTECLRPVTSAPIEAEEAQEPPFYERHGEKQVAAGKYDRVIRYREHILPLAHALRRGD